MDDDWDLQAVVRGCATTTTATTSSSSSSTTTWSMDVHPLSTFQPQQDHHFLSFPDLFEPRNQSIDPELHDLYKPFFPKLHNLSSQNIPIFSPLSVLGGLQDLSQQHKQKQIQIIKQSVGASRNTIATAAATRHTQGPRSKRRKNQLKRVCQVPAEGLSSDMWSWRKYGQKPIKGSPYPRGYYRCSTSKGCSARKQVERNRSDPDLFVVTFTGEHNHPIPTHRNSLAGSTRQKPISASDPSKPSSSPPLSPAAEKIEREDTVEEEDDEFGVSNLVMSDDFFEGLEEVAGPAFGDGFSDHFPASLTFPWWANNAATTAAGGG